jgi:DNA-directed RNA polymerase specialized sigma24 family protein
MGSLDTAQRTLEVVGAKQFRQSDVAKEALEIAMDELKPGDDIVQVSFEIFMELLDDYGKLVQAFEAGIERLPIGYLLKRVPPEDAEDIGQQVSIAAWRSFREFRAMQPGSWDAWLIMISRNKLNNHWQKMYNKERRSNGPLIEFDESNHLMYKDHRAIEADRRGWSIREICMDWIEYENEDAKATFAAQILAMYQGQSGWVGPTGTKMCKMIGLDGSSGSRSRLYKWWKEFIGEVHKREGAS